MSRAEQAAPCRVLVVDDDATLLECIELVLAPAGYRVEVAATGGEALRKLEARDYDVAVTDLMLPDLGGLELIRRAKAFAADLPIILMTGHSSLDSAVEALRTGAVDYIMKPFDNDDLRFAIDRAFNERRMRRENAVLKRNQRRTLARKTIVGESEAIRRLHEIIGRVAASDANVLIEGESGTGKELVAQAIHNNGVGADGPFVAVNCGAIPAELLESELFGHRKGAYTGAVTESEGLIREADGGTLFLDEISTLALNLQVKLLRVIQDKQVRPVGSKRTYQLNVRFVAASNLSLREEVERGAFRADLFYRLNVITIRVPPLRERGGDIERLARHFLERHSRELGKPGRAMSEALRRSLYEYHWPGNVRELENFIERSLILCDGPTLTSSELHEDAAGAHRPFAEAALERALSVEDYIRAFVQRYQDEHTEIELARMLGIGRKALWVRRRQWKLPRPRARTGRRAASG